MNSKTKVTGVALVIAIGAFTGCQSVQERVAQFTGRPAPSSATNTSGSNQLPGLPAALTSGLGSVAVLKALGNDDAEKFAIGIAVGTWVVDRVYTAEVNKRRANYQKESDYLDSEIDVAQASVSAKKSQLAKAQGDLTRQRQTVASLEASAKQNKLAKADAEKALADINASIKSINEEVQIAQAEVQIATEAVNTSKSIKDPSVTEAELEARRTELLAKRDQRLEQYKLFLDTQKQAEELRNRVALLQ
jgi:hypothetical protein